MPWHQTLCLFLLSVAPSSIATTCGEPGAVRYEPRTFLGYDCEAGCERHKAGFRWAERRDVTDPRRCAALPKAESEGCAVYAEQGRHAEAAGRRWAIENEIVHQCDCRGAGARFFAGCSRQLLQPTNTY